MSDTTTDVVDARPADEPVTGSSNGSDHAQSNGTGGGARRKSGAGLNGMVLAELQRSPPGWASPAPGACARAT